MKECDVPPGGSVGPALGSRLRMAGRDCGRSGLAFRRLLSLLMIPGTESR
jgi:hypothetical protein